MYATCLFCNKDLGANESFESFPVGKRLAFDAAKGRLWVVCTHCERWNLSPLEERWEAIERAEALYRETRTRVATDNIGLAKLRDGTTIIRIGTPMRPEFAAWRYGDQFGRRRNRQALIAGASVAAVAGVIIGGATVGVGIGGLGWSMTRVIAGMINGFPNTKVAKVSTDRHGLVSVTRRNLAESSIERASDGSMAINLRFQGGSTRFEGREAERVAAIVIPKVNRFGGSKQQVRDAVAEIEAEGGPDGYLRRLTASAGVITDASHLRAAMPEFPGWAGFRVRRGRWGGAQWQFKEGLFALPPEQRLALEMSLHEEAERRALTGELAELERAWKDAEEIAAISDDLLVAPAVDRALEAIKRKG